MAGKEAGPKKTELIDKLKAKGHLEGLIQKNLVVALVSSARIVEEVRNFFKKMKEGEDETALAEALSQEAINAAYTATEAHKHGADVILTDRDATNPMTFVSKKASRTLH